MPEAVIVATARSPIGRAGKGSLRRSVPTTCRRRSSTALLDKVPALPRDQIEDLIMGCGQPAGEAGFNIARVVAVLAGLDDVPGVTVNRYCSSSLQTIRMAAHAIKAGEGDVFIAAGVETVSRYGIGRQRHGAERPLRHGRRAHGRAGARRQPGVDAAVGPARHLHRHGPDRRERRRVRERHPRGDGRVRQAVPGPGRANIENGFFGEEITPVTLPDGTVVSQGRRPTRRHHPRGAGPAQAGVPSRRHGHRRQRLPAQRRRRRGGRDERHQGGTQLGLTPLARIVSSGVTGLNPEIMGLGPIEASRQALARAGMTIDDIDLVEINEAFAAQVIPSAKHLGIDWEKLNVNGGGIALGHPFGMTGARIMTTLIHGLQAADKTFGLETMCVGGGQGMAMIVERLS